jgi:hypothetical protein
MQRQHVVLQLVLGEADDSGQQLIQVQAGGQTGRSQQLHAAAGRVERNTHCCGAVVAAALRAHHGSAALG